MKLKIIFLIIFSFLFIFGCEKEDEVEPIPTDDTEVINYNPDWEGNLCILNLLLEDTLFLYVDGQFYRGIPHNTTFVIMVNTSGSATTLKLWKKSDVNVDDINNPDESLLFSCWVVVLSPSTAENERTTWVINEVDETSIGTGEFIYPLTGENNIPTIYSADVHIASKQNSIAMSIAPGTFGKKLGLEYDLHIVYFHYRHSDPTTPEGKIYVGWSDDIDSSDIYLNLNAAYPLKTIVVPIYYYSSIGRKGTITIVNNIESTVKILANNAPIEEIILNYGIPSPGMSILDTGETFSYLIPEGEYTIKVMDAINNTIVEVHEFNIIELYDYNYEISNSIEYQTIQIVNNTDQKLTFHNGSNDEYLGYYIEPGKTGEFEFDNSINSLKAINWFNTGNAILNNITTSTTTWTITSLN